MDEVSIQIVEQPTPEMAQEFSRLMPQLLNRPVAITVDKLSMVINQPGTKLFIALLSDKIVGTAQLTIYDRTYTPMAWVDGVVVDSEVRGKGIASKLMDAVLIAAKELGIAELNLTSSPKREAANHLYEKLGFKQHETKYYRYKLDA